MDIAETKKLLQRIYLLDHEIDSLIAEKESYECMAVKMTQSLNSSHGGNGKNDKVAELSAKIIDMEIEITDKIDSLYDSKKELINLIRLLKNSRHVKVLILRHVRYMTFSEISEKMDCNLRNTYKIYNRAVDSLRDVLSESDKNLPKGSMGKEK